MRADLKGPKDPEIDKAAVLRENMTGFDVTQYSPAVMQNRALLMLAKEDLDSLYDIDPEQVPYIAYLRAIDSRIPGGIPGTMAFLENQLSLSRSKDRKGRIEFGQALNKQNIVYPAGMPFAMPMQQQTEKEGLLRRFLFKKKDDNNV